MADYLADDDSKGKKAGKSKGDWWKLIKLPVYVAAGFVGAWLLFRAFGLYQIAFTKWGVAATGSACGGFDVIPLVGGWIGGGCGNIAKIIIGFIALICMLAVTAIESIPTLIYFHVDAIEGMVDQLRFNKRQYQPLTAQQGDTEAIEALTERHKRLSETGLKTLIIASILAFVFEAFVVWTARGSHASLVSVLIDSLAFEGLLFCVLAFRNVFLPKAPKKTRSYS